MTSPRPYVAPYNPFKAQSDAYHKEQAISAARHAEMQRQAYAAEIAQITAEDWQAPEGVEKYTRRNAEDIHD